MSYILTNISAKKSDNNIEYINIAGQRSKFKDFSQHDVEQFEKTAMHVIMIGNPGSGKSTLLNSAANKILFKSGVSHKVTGITTALQTISHEKFRDLKFSDTPGLSDIETKRQAAEKIRKGLSIGGPTKLVFVWTTSSGRVTAEHYATTKVVLEALKQLNVQIKGKYTVILNQVNPKETLAYAKNMPADLVNTSKLAKLSDIRKFMMELETIEPLREIGLPGSCEILYTVPEIEYEDNVLLPITQINWLRGVLMSAPVLDLPINNNVSIDYNDITSKIDEMDRQLKAARETNIEMNAEHKEYVRQQIIMAKHRERRHAVGYAVLGAVVTAAVCVIM